MACPTLSFEQLSVEIKGMIIRRLPDTKSLLACIAASPHMLAIYRLSRDEIFTYIVKNEIGVELIQQAVFLRKSPLQIHTLDDYVYEPGMVSLTDAKALLRDEKLSRSIIQTCIEDELEQKVELSDIEWLRLRRGLYNMRVAVLLARSEVEAKYRGEDKAEAESDAEFEFEVGIADYWFDFGIVDRFCQQCTTNEILEILYVLHCLQNRLGKYLCTLENATLRALVHDFHQPRYNDAYRMYGRDCMAEMFRWNMKGPWEHDIDVLFTQCQIPADWSKWESLPKFSRWADSMPILQNFIPQNHDFADAEGGGVYWFRHHKASDDSPNYDYRNAIHLGFMIWDDRRLESMSWMLEPPPLESVMERWEARYEDYRTVGQRYQAAQTPHWKMRSTQERRRLQTQKLLQSSKTEYEWLLALRKHVREIKGWTDSIPGSPS